MSDRWYRDPPPLYDDGKGGVWTVEGVCLNPVHGCEEPEWLGELRRLDLLADIMLGLAGLRRTEAVHEL